MLNKRMRADRQFSALLERFEFFTRSPGGTSAGVGNFSGDALRLYGSERSMCLDRSRGSKNEDADDPLSHARARLLDGRLVVTVRVP